MLYACLSLAAEAQVKSGKKKASTKNLVVKKAAKPAKKDKGTVMLTNASANAAYAPSATEPLRIADPTIKALNLRAAGADINSNVSPIMGMPKATYGIANGKILFRNTTATTSGTTHGSGAVGTGTSLLGVGTAESALGVNGKSPYAGTWLWGDRRPVYAVPIRDTARRQ